MATRSRRSFTVREEVLNVTLAGLLNRRGLLSVPESILGAAAGRGRKLPDITLADLWGVRIVIEGRNFTSPAAKRSLFNDANKRVEEGISPICLAVLYPPELRQLEADTDLAAAIEDATLIVRVISEGSEGEWAETNVDGLAEILRRSYELLVNEDIVASSVGSLEEAIETASAHIAAVKAAPVRLRKLLGIPERK
jgi:hypothetical protein